MKGMFDAGSPGSVRKFHGVALANLGDTEGFDLDGKKYRLYAFQLSEVIYKRKEVNFEGVGSLTFGELTDINTLHAVPKWIHMLAFKGCRSRLADWMI